MYRVITGVDKERKREEEERRRLREFFEQLDGLLLNYVMEASRRQMVTTPATKEDLEEFTELVTYTQKNKETGEEKENDSNNCAVCQEKFLDQEELRQIHLCHHQFHSACVDPWLLKCSKYCPLCRKSITETRDSAQNRPLNILRRQFSSGNTNRHTSDQES